MKLIFCVVRRVFALTSSAGGVAQVHLSDVAAAADEAGPDPHWGRCLGGFRGGVQTRGASRLALEMRLVQEGIPVSVMI